MSCFCIPPRDKSRSRLVPVPADAMAAAAATSGESEGAAADDDVHLSPTSGGSGRLKLLCSFGGRIVPCPSDGSLKYVGGENRVLALPRSVPFTETKKKVEEMFKTEAAAIKYQLLAEDLDVLVSVTSDEDLAHMRDQYDRLEAKRSPSSSPRFRLYIFSSPSAAVSPSSAAAASARHVGQLHQPFVQPESHVEPISAPAGLQCRGRPFVGHGAAYSAGNSPRATAGHAPATLQRVSSTPNLGGSSKQHGYVADGIPPVYGRAHFLHGNCHHQCCCCCCCRRHSPHHQCPAARGPVPPRPGGPTWHGMCGCGYGYGAVRPTPPRGEFYYQPPAPAGPTLCPSGRAHFRNVDEVGPGDHQTPTMTTTARGGSPFGEPARKAKIIWD